MLCWIKRLWVGGRLQPRHFLCMRTYEYGRLTFEVVKSEQLKRPSNRLRFESINGARLFADLYDARLERISAEEFIFAGIEAPEPHGGMAQYYAQAWEVSVNEPDIQKSGREFQESQKARGLTPTLPK